MRTVQNPSRLATLVFAVSDFQFLGFSAAETFADRYPSFIARADPGWFVTDRRRCSLARARATHAERGGGGVGQEGEEEDGGKVEERKSEREGETVGATVCDGFGNVACVTSTGGVTNKWEGRIGDSAIIGAGSYACNAVGAVSGTGWGEEFLRFSAASRVCFAVEMSNVSMRDAVYEVVHNVFRKDTGGFVAVSNDGEAVMDFNSDAMFRASRNWRGEECVKIWH